MHYDHCIVNSNHRHLHHYYYYQHYQVISATEITISYLEIFICYCNLIIDNVEISIYFQVVLF